MSFDIEVSKLFAKENAALRATIENLKYELSQTNKSIKSMVKIEKNRTFTLNPQALEISKQRALISDSYFFMKKAYPDMACDHKYSTHCSACQMLELMLYLRERKIVEDRDER